VFLAARRQDELERVAKRLGNNAVPIATDITRQEDLDRLFETIRERVGHLDIVVPNAGEAVFAKIGDYTHELMDQTFDLNLKGTVFTVQGALPLMSEGGSIVLMSSINATRAATMVGIYGATKAALQSFARTWADELKDRRIRVNSISPGVIFTPAYTRAGSRWRLPRSSISNASRSAGLEHRRMSAAPWHSLRETTAVGSMPPISLSTVAKRVWPDRQSSRTQRVRFIPIVSVFNLSFGIRLRESRCPLKL
jgi:NAD(P)-dependent dehydrogenase (short-subunit alcohol dehydrogenase family)